MKQTTKQMLESAPSRRLARRWAISLALTVALFVTYHGDILLVATNKPLLARLGIALSRCAATTG